LMGEGKDGGDLQDYFTASGRKGEEMDLNFSRLGGIRG